jgi:hypothetical protein
MMCECGKNNMIIEKQRKQYKRFRPQNATDTDHQFMRPRC